MSPRVGARSSRQPWALGQNAAGVFGASLARNHWLLGRAGVRKSNLREHAKHVLPVRGEGDTSVARLPNGPVSIDRPHRSRKYALRAHDRARTTNGQRRVKNLPAALSSPVSRYGSEKSLVMFEGTSLACAALWPAASRSQPAARAPV